MIICILFGHKYKKFLEVVESNSSGEPWNYNGKNINKKISTFFLCSRCLSRHKHNESFIKDNNLENEVTK
jgi:hypothetical protein